MNMINFNHALFKRLSVYLLASLSVLFMGTLISACDSSENSSASTFDLMIQAQPSEQGNAPFNVSFSTRNNGPLDGEYIWAWQFGDGNQSAEAEPTHTFENEGEYLVELDVKEKKSGSKAKASLTIKVLGASDLQVTDVVFSPITSTSVGKELLVTWIYENLGSSASTPFDFTIFASQDDVYSPDDIMLAQLSHQADQRQVFEQNLVIPETLTMGEWRLGVIADGAKIIGDSNITNNLAFAISALKVRENTSNGTDLSICGIDIPAFAVLEPGQTAQIPQGDQLALKICIANLGNRPAINPAYAIYLSDDDRLDDADLRLTLATGAAILQMDRVYEDVLIDIPLDTPIGAKKLIVVADPEDEDIEILEDNNIRVSPTSINIVMPDAVSGVDLVVSQLSFDQQRVYWGQQLSGQITLINRGDMAVGRLFVVRLIAVPVDGGEEIQLPSLNINGIEASTSLDQPIAVTVSRRLPKGRYRIKAVVDPTNATNDVNPSNNQRSNTNLFELGGDPNFDPAVTAIRLNLSEINVGQSLTASLTLKNLGMDATQGFDVSIYLGADRLYDAGDRQVGALRIENIDAQSAKDVEIMFEIPADLDQQVNPWYVMAYVDPNQQLASSELTTENNRLFAEQSLQISGATGGCAEDLFEENDLPAQATLFAMPSLNDLGICDEADWYQVDLPSQKFAIFRLSFNASQGIPLLSLRALNDDVIDQAELIKATENTDEQILKLIVPVNATNQNQSKYLKVEGGGAKLQYQLSQSVISASAQALLSVDHLVARPGVAEANSVVELSYQLRNLGQVASIAQSARLSLVTQPTKMDGVDLGTIDLASISALGAGTFIHRFELPDTLVDGLYYLLITLENADTDENGISWAVTPLRIDADRACNSDQFEPNGSPFEMNGINQNATQVTSGTYDQLYTCIGDDDWYRIRVEANQALSAAIVFNTNDGDLDLALYAADGTTLIERSAGLQGQEIVDVLRNLQAQDYLLRVYLNANDQNNTSTPYRLVVTVGASAVCQDDVNEPNGDFNSALPLADGRQELIMCPGDEDWFAFNLPAGNTFSVQLVTGVGNVTMALFDPDQQLIAQSDRRIVHEAVFNGSYLLRVKGLNPNAETAQGYTLSISGVSGLDLALDQLTLSSPFGAFNDQILARATLSNQRADVASQVLVRFSLSTDQRPSVDDLILGEQRVAQIPGTAQVDIRQRLTVPMGAMVGSQWILAEIDPLRTLPDLRPANNLAFQAFEILNACIDDDQRTNESILTPTPIDFLAGRFEGVICAYTEDYLSFEASAGTLSFNMSADQDLDLYIYDEMGQEIGRSATETGNEALRLNLMVPQRLIIRVDGFLDARSQYVVTWN
jgi:PKD repeat protein